MPRRTLLLLAQTPPPHHGQSAMVQRVLDTLQADPDWRVCHVNLRLSATSDDIGEPQPRKLAALAACRREALAVIRRERPDAVYYVPAPGQLVPMLRDALLLPAIRARVPHTILHWQAVGLSERVQALPLPLRLAVRRIYRHATLSLVQSPRVGFDALYFASEQAVVLPNGLPDACPDAAEVIAARAARLDDPTHRRELLYLSNLQIEKGVLTAMAAAHELARHGPVRLRLAGGYVSQQERAEIEAALHHPGPATIEYVGFADEAHKRTLLAEADALVFPTHYRNEGFPLVLIEALNAGLPVVTTPWRGIPDLLPTDYPHYAPEPSPVAVANALRVLFAQDRTALMHQLRAHYEAHYALEVFERGLRDALEQI